MRGDGGIVEIGETACQIGIGMMAAGPAQRIDGRCARENAMGALHRDVGRGLDGLKRAGDDRCVEAGEIEPGLASQGFGAALQMPDGVGGGPDRLPGRTSVCQLEKAVSRKCR